MGGLHASEAKRRHVRTHKLMRIHSTLFSVDNFNKRSAFSMIPIDCTTQIVSIDEY